MFKSPPSTSPLNSSFVTAKQMEDDDRSVLTEESKPEAPFDPTQERIALGMTKRDDLGFGDATAVTDASLEGMSLSTTTDKQGTYSITMEDYINTYHERAASHRVGSKAFDDMFDPDPTDQELLEAEERDNRKTYSNTVAIRGETAAMREENSERHEETMIGLAENKDAVDDAKEELLEAGHIHQAEAMARFDEMEATLLNAIKEATAKNEPEEVTRLKKQLEQERAELRKAVEGNRKLKIQQKKTDDENHILKAQRKADEKEISLLRSIIQRSAKKATRPSLAPVPSNRQPIPATKRMVVAEMKHVGLKTDTALVGAEGVKRGNSSTLLP